MKEIISCCGITCSSCDYLQEGCTGCHDIEGKPFWLQYTKGIICDTYNCCINKSHFTHCGQCSKLLCKNYDAMEYPAKSKQENEETFATQLKTL